MDVRSISNAGSSWTRCATLGAGLAGTSSGTAYVESIAGIRMGARTGRASVVTALCFLPCFFVGPLAAAVPGYATAAVLVLVGLSMFQSVTTLNFASIEDSLPAFVTIVLIPLTLSITQGILWGFLLHALLYAVVGRARGGAADHVGARGAVSGTAADRKVRAEGGPLPAGSSGAGSRTLSFPARQSPRWTASGLSRRNEPKTSPVTPGIADRQASILRRAFAPLTRHEQLRRAASERRGAYVVGQRARRAAAVRCRPDSSARSPCRDASAIADATSTDTATSSGR